MDHDFGDDFPEDPTDEEIQRMVHMETHLHPELDAAGVAEKVLKDAAPAAAHAMVRLATKGTSDQIRYRASAYILDRALGKPGEGSNMDEWDKLFSDIKADDKQSRR